MHILKNIHNKYDIKTNYFTIQLFLHAHVGLL